MPLLLESTMSATQQTGEISTALLVKAKLSKMTKEKVLHWHAQLNHGTVRRVIASNACLPKTRINHAHSAGCMWSPLQALPTSKDVEVDDPYHSEEIVQIAPL